MIAPAAPRILIPTLGPIVAPERRALIAGIEAIETRLWRDQRITVELIRGLNTATPEWGLWRAADPLADNARAVFAHHSGHWIAARLNGRVVSTQVLQFVPLGSSSLARYLKREGMDFRDRGWLVAGPARALAGRIAGATAYIGGGWKHPDIRGRDPWRTLFGDLTVLACAAGGAKPHPVGGPEFERNL